MNNMRINRLTGRRFILNCDCNDVDLAAPLGNAAAWIRDWHARAFAGGAEVYIADIALPDLVDTKDTPTGEILGSRFPEGEREKIHWYQVISELISCNTDVLHLACEEGHKTGALVLAGMRMSDAHHGNRWQPASDAPLFSQFCMDHPGWCNTWADGSIDATLNYAVPEVREHRLAILRELALNYDIDGIELNWMRWCRHFPQGTQRENVHYLTDFIAMVRQMMDEVAARKGVERMVLGHRVPVTVDECYEIGCDVDAWVKKGYADFLAPMDFLLVDLNTRTDEFAELVKGSDCLVYPGFGSTKYSFGRMYDDNNLYEGKDNHRAVMMRSLDMFRGVARNFYGLGADGTSSFNMYIWQPAQQDFFTKALDILAGKAPATAGARHYLYLPVWKDHMDGHAPTGRLNAQSLTFGAETVGQRQVFNYLMADGKNGEKLEGTLRIRLYHALPGDEFQFDINGIAISSACLRCEHQPDGEVMEDPTGPEGLPDGELHPAFVGSVPFSWPANLRVDISLTECPPFCGFNELGITLLKRDPASSSDPVMEALEIRVTAPVNG